MKITILAFAVNFAVIVTNAQVGIGTTAPNSTLEINGSLAAGVRTFSGAYTADISDYNLIFTGTSATTLTLPTAAGITGRIYTIKNASSNTSVLTIATTSSQTIDGITTQLLSNTNQSLSVVSNGTGWNIVGYALPSGSGTNWSQGGNSVSGVTSLGTLSNHALPFITNNTEKMRLSTSGFLGIGTTSPGARIHAVSESSESGDDYIFDDYTNTTTQGIFLRRARGTVASPSNLQNGDPISYLRFVGRYNGTLGYTNGSGIDAYYLGDGTLDSTDLRFVSSGGERMRINHRGDVAIGTTTFNSSNPEQLIVDAGSGGTSFQNVIVAKGNTNSYAQLNIQNTNSNASASSDVVATADNGNETTNYVDMGINSSTNSANYFGGLNDAYLYSIGNGVNSGGNLYIGTAQASRDLAFLTGGGTKSSGSTMNNERMRILGTGNIGIGTNSPTSTLDVEGSISRSITNTTGDLTLTSAHHTVIISSGSPSITLPTANSTNEGRIYIIVNNTGTNRTISSYQALGGAGSTTIAPNSSITIQAYNNNWWRIQ
jgi:hypothetical protein